MEDTVNIEATRVDTRGRSEECMNTSSSHRSTERSGGNENRVESPASFGESVSARGQIFSSPLSEEDDDDGRDFGEESRPQCLPQGPVDRARLPSVCSTSGAAVSLRRATVQDVSPSSVENPNRRDSGCSSSTRSRILSNDVYAEQENLFQTVEQTARHRVDRVPSMSNNASQRDGMEVKGDASNRSEVTVAMESGEASTTNSNSSSSSSSSSSSYVGGVEYGRIGGRPLFAGQVRATGGGQNTEEELSVDSADDDLQFLDAEDGGIAVAGQLSDSQPENVPPCNSSNTREEQRAPQQQLTTLQPQQQQQQQVQPATVQQVQEQQQQPEQQVHVQSHHEPRPQQQQQEAPPPLQQRHGEEGSPPSQQQQERQHSHLEHQQHQQQVADLVALQRGPQQQQQEVISSEEEEQQQQEEEQEQEERQGQTSSRGEPRGDRFNGVREEEEETTRDNVTNTTDGSTDQRRTRVSGRRLSGGVHETTGRSSRDTRERVQHRPSEEEEQHSPQTEERSAADKSQEEDTSSDDDNDNDDGENDGRGTTRRSSKKYYGCQHYRRRCKVVAPCCVLHLFLQFSFEEIFCMQMQRRSGEAFWCRHCHNDVKCEQEKDFKKAHEIDRTAVTEVICAVCDTRQGVSNRCIKCAVEFGKYYCDKCKFWDDKGLKKKVYHCDLCGLCRTGGAESFFHCTTCGSCYSTDIRGSHKCVEKAMHQPCPICCENMFTSIRQVHVLKCGHTLHADCLERLKSECSGMPRLRCPLCFRSLGEYSVFWRRLDEEVARTPLPHELRRKVSCACNDCAAKTEVDYHVVGVRCCAAGLKCGACGSYNTREVGP